MLFGFFAIAVNVVYFKILRGITRGHLHEDEETKARYGHLYLGYRTDLELWELVTNFKKLLVTSILDQPPALRCFNLFLLANHPIDRMAVFFTLTPDPT